MHSYKLQFFIVLCNIRKHLQLSGIRNSTDFWKNSTNFTKRSVKILTLRLRTEIMTKIGKTENRKQMQTKNETKRRWRDYKIKELLNEQRNKQINRERDQRLLFCVDIHAVCCICLSAARNSLHRFNAIYSGFAERQKLDALFKKYNENMAKQMLESGYINMLYHFDLFQFFLLLYS